MRLKSHREIQELLVNKIIRYLGYAIFPILLVNLSRFFIVGWLYTFNFYVIGSIIIFVISRCEKKLSYSFKIFVLISFFSGIAVSTGLNFGMVSFIGEMLILTVFIGVTFLKKKAAFFVYALCGFLLACCAVMSITGVIPLVPVSQKQIDSIPSWASFLVTFLFMVSIIIFIAGNIGNLLAEKIKALEEKNDELIKANEEVRKLQGILPICSNCKKVRDDKGYWNQVESYIESHSTASFTHSMCPECSDKLYGERIGTLK